MKHIFSLIIIILILGSAMLVGSQNESIISVNYLIAKSDIRISTLIGVCIAIGTLIGFLIMLTSWLAMRIKLIALRAKIKKLSKEN